MSTVFDPIHCERDVLVFNGMQSLVVGVDIALVFEHILVVLAGVIFIRTAR